MLNKHSVVILTVVISASFKGAFSFGDEEIRCVAKSCKDVTCAPLPPKCNVNDTSSGVYMLSPDICNCCEYCLANLAEGNPCSVGDPSNAKHSAICGPGLACAVEKEDQTDGTCKKMSTLCALAQQSYDTRRALGYLGQMETRVTCDDDGLYGNYKCIPGQTCYCTNSTGNRTFGEADYNVIPNYMSCGCSRAYQDGAEIVGRELHPHEHFRCTPNGDYDRLQCINEQCLCVDALDGAPTYPDKKLVDMADIDNDKLPCTNSTGQYYQKCEEEYMAVYKEVLAKKNESGYSLVLGYKYPNCDLDGTYAPVQENRTHKYCVDKSGAILMGAIVEKTDALATNMDCKCARSTLVMTTLEKPSCLANGNYSPLQCRRGVCRCVDPDGNQKCSSDTKQCEEVDESAASTLKCT